MPTTRPEGALDIELLATGPNAHGYGHLNDDRGFAFRVRNRKARLEIYRSNARDADPAPADIELVAERPIGSMSLESRRNVTTLLHDLVGEARPEHCAQERTLRAYLVRLDAIIGGWNDWTAPESAA